MRRAALLVLVLASAARAGDLPEVLRRFGFGDPKLPVHVEYIGPIGKDADRPAQPLGTIWTFKDPAPVWKALSSAGAGRFAKDQFPEADGRLVLTVGPRATGPSIVFHYRPGWATICASTPAGGKRGGEWTFDPAADRALVELLRATRPTNVGAPRLWSEPAAYTGGIVPLGLEVRVARTPATFERLRESFAPRYRTSELRPYKSVKLGEHALIAVWLPPGTTKDRLDPRDARIAGSTLRWEVAHVPEEEKAARWAPAVLAAFAVPDGVKRLEVRVGRRKLAVVDLSNAREFAPGPIACRVIVRDPARAGDDEIYCYANGTYQRRRGDAAFCGTLPEAVREAVDDAVANDPSFALHLGTKHFVVGPGAKTHEGFRKLLAYVEQAHAR
jgi:hypothetical protein